MKIQKKKWLALLLALCMLVLTACELAVPRSDGRMLSAAPSVPVEQLATEKKAVGFAVSKAFSSDMVIQRDEPIRVWGWANESRDGETVTATFAGKTAEGKIEDGAWTVTFEDGFAASAALGNHMTVTCGSDKVVLEDVLVGDVYMVIGQSNVAYGMNAHCANHKLSLSDFADESAPIRLKYNTLNDTTGYPTRGTEEVCEDVINGRPWWTPTVSNISPFSALGYLFAREIVERTEGKIPVGIIEIDGNGQPIGAFMPNRVAGEMDSDTYNADSGILVPPGVNGVAARYMYNHYIYPYEQYALAGLIWYQGESDFEKANADTFVNKFTALMTYMRSTHNLGNKDFPVYVVEIPTIYNRPANYTGQWHFLDLGYIRAEMGSIPQKLPNSYMAVSSDLFTDDGYNNSLHPDIKDGQAERLADLAGSVQYGLGALDTATGPILKSYEVSEDRKTIQLTFTNVGEGLTTSDGGTAVKGFATFNRVGGVADAGVTATITAPDTVTVTSDKAMYGVIYNHVYDNFYGKQVNLCNSNGKIAAAFTFSEERMYQTRHELVGEDAGEGAGEMVPGATDTVAIHFKATSDMVAVGTQLLKSADAATGGKVTVSLYSFKTDYATSVAASPIATDTWTYVDHYGWVELAGSRNRTWDAGEYLLVISDAEGIILQTGGEHEGQFCYRNGTYLADTSILVGVTYAQKVDEVYAIPNDPNAPVETEPETFSESETVPDSEEMPDTAQPTETIPDGSDSETLADTVPADTVLADTVADSDGGCGSVMGGMMSLWVLLGAASCALSRRNKED